MYRAEGDKSIKKQITKSDQNIDILPSDKERTIYKD